MDSKYKYILVKLASKKGQRENNANKSLSAKNNALDSKLHYDFFNG
jgi:hypothetical protein